VSRCWHFCFGKMELVLKKVRADRHADVAWPPNTGPFLLTRKLARVHRHRSARPGSRQIPGSTRFKLAGIILPGEADQEHLVSIALGTMRWCGTLKFRD
jgi:hypothetical protein